MRVKKDKYRLEGRRITRTGKPCPKCGAGIFMAEHRDRLHCGKCGYTEWKGQKPAGEPEQAPTEKKQPEAQKEEEGKE